MKIVALAYIATAAAQFGSRNFKAGGPTGNGDVDLAMAGWEQLSQNPDKMREVMESMKDPEVMAKAQEMLKDPAYMQAARAKVEALQAKAQANGLLDANGQPMPGAAMQQAMQGLGLGQGAGAADPTAAMGDARQWEMENVARHRAGELNDAEMGMANLKNAMGGASPPPPRPPASGAPLTRPRLRPAQTPI